MIKVDKNKIEGTPILKLAMVKTFKLVKVVKYDNKNTTLET